MAARLENLVSGTPVCCETSAAQIVGEVRSVYTTGDSRVAEFLCVRWNDRDGDTLVPTDDVLEIRGEVVVLRSSRATYADLVRFDPHANPMLHPLR